LIDLVVWWGLAVSGEILGTFQSGGGGTTDGGPVGADAGTAVPDVPGAAGAAAAVVPKGRRALAAARPPPLPRQLVLHAPLILHGNICRHDLSTVLLYIARIFEWDVNCGRWRVRYGPSCPGCLCCSCRCPFSDARIRE
jgi:hypothetical protein